MFNKNRVSTSHRLLRLESLENRYLLTVMRIGTWNTANHPNDATDIDNFETVIEAIGNEDVLGTSKRMDVLSFSESDTSSAAELEDIFDTLYSTTTYEVITTAADGGGDRTGFVYDTSTVTLIDSEDLDTGLTHNSLRAQFRPAGTTGDEDFFIYSVHLKSGSSSSDKTTRADEAEVIRDDADALGDGVNVIFAGDFNMHDSTEAAWTEITTSGNASASDLADAPGDWADNSDFIDLHTHSTSSMGMRFDLQFATDELFDGIGLDYVDGSFHVFGNDGSHTMGSSITTGTGASSTVLSALEDASDHLPIVADYEIVSSSTPDALINEIYVNPPSSDDDREYIEIITDVGNTDLTDLWLLEIEGDGSGAGNVDAVQNLGSLTTGSNGILVLGDDYTTSTPWTVDPDSTLADLSGGTIENGSITFLLVEGFTGSTGNDLDTNNDGALDSTPWTSIVDSVGWSDGGSSDYVYSTASLTQASGVPDAATRFPGDTTATSSSAWYNGDMTGSGTSVTYSTTASSSNLPSGGVITPGEENYDEAPTIVLNEIYVNPPSSDDEREYIEILSDVGNVDLTDLWVLEIEGDGSGAGNVDAVQNLGSLTTGSNGLLILGDDYTTSTPWTIDSATTLADLSGGAIENGSITFLLVEGFTGSTGNDLDTNNDGTLDSSPWTSIVDSVGWSDGGSSDYVYSTASLTQASGVPDAATRFPGDTTATSLSAWYNGDMTGSGTSVTYSTTASSSNLPSGGVITPGEENYDSFSSMSSLLAWDDSSDSIGSSTDEDEVFEELARDVVKFRSPARNNWLAVRESLPGRNLRASDSFFHTFEGGWEGRKDFELELELESVS